MTSVAGSKLRAEPRLPCRMDLYAITEPLDTRRQENPSKALRVSNCCLFGVLHRPPKDRAVPYVHLLWKQLGQLHFLYSVVFAGFDRSELAGFYLGIQFFL